MRSSRALTTVRTGYRGCLLQPCIWQELSSQSPICESVRCLCPPDPRSKCKSESSRFRVRARLNSRRNSVLAGTSPTACSLSVTRPRTGGTVPQSSRINHWHLTRRRTFCTAVRMCSKASRPIHDHSHKRVFFGLTGTLRGSTVRQDAWACRPSIPRCTSRPSKH